MGESRRLVHRRTVAKGTAWAVPVIVAAAGTPAFASSVCTTTCSDLTASTGALNFGTGTTWNTTTNSFGNGWTGATSPTTAKFMAGSDTHVFRSPNWTPGATAGCKSGQTTCSAGTAVGAVTIGFGGDPLQANTTVSYTSKIFCLPKGKYTFSFTYSFVGCWFRTQYLTAYLVNADTGVKTQVGNQVAAPAASAPGHGTISATITVATQATYQWRYEWTFGTDTGATYTDNTCTTNANDIGISAPSCSFVAA